MKDASVKTRCFSLANGVHITVVEESVINVSETLGVGWLSGSKRPLAVTVQIGKVSHTFELDPDSEGSSSWLRVRP